MSKQREAAKRPVRLTNRAAAYLNEEARTTVLRQRATAEAYDRSVARLFVLSAALIVASAILGHLAPGSSDVGLLSWIVIGVTGAAWIVGAVGDRLRLARPAAVPVATAMPGHRRRRELVQRDLASESADRTQSDSTLEQKRRWMQAFTQLVALQTAVIVAVELAAR